MGNAAKLSPAQLENRERINQEKMDASRLTRALRHRQRNIKNYRLAPCHWPEASNTETRTTADGLRRAASWCAECGYPIPND